LSLTGQGLEGGFFSTNIKSLTGQATERMKAGFTEFGVEIGGKVFVVLI